MGAGFLSLNDPSRSTYYMNGTMLMDPTYDYGVLKSPYSGDSNTLSNQLNTTLENTEKSTNWFGKNGILGNAAMGLEALSGLANAYTGYKAYKLAKQQFGFQKALANRNLANQAKIINNTYDNAAQVAAGMIGSRGPNNTYGFTDPNVTAKYEQRAKDKHVNGSAI